MKVTTLACDWCVAVVPAVASLSLVAGKPHPSDPALDLCKGHHAELLRAFARKSQHTGGRRGRTRVPVAEKLAAVDAKRQRDRERHRANHLAEHPPSKRAVRMGPPVTKSGRPGNGQAPWVERESLLLSLVPSVGYIKTLDLYRQARETAQWRVLKMTKGVYSLVLKRLKAKRLIAQKGNRRYSSYAQAGTHHIEEVASA